MEPKEPSHNSSNKPSDNKEKEEEPENWEESKSPLRRKHKKSKHSKKKSKKKSIKRRRHKKGKKTKHRSKEDEKDKAHVDDDHSDSGDPENEEDFSAKEKMLDLPINEDGIVAKDQISGKLEKTNVNVMPVVNKSCDDKNIQNVDADNVNDIYESDEIRKDLEIFDPGLYIADSSKKSDSPQVWKKLPDSYEQYIPDMVSSKIDQLQTGEKTSTSGCLISKDRRSSSDKSRSNSKTPEKDWTQSRHKKSRKQKISKSRQMKKSGSMSSRSESKEQSWESGGKNYKDKKSDRRASMAEERPERSRSSSHFSHSRSPEKRLQFTSTAQSSKRCSQPRTSNEQMHSQSPKSRSHSRSPRRNERSVSPRRNGRSRSPRKNRRSTSRRRNRRSRSPKRNGRSRSPRGIGRSRSPRRNRPSVSPRRNGRSRSPRKNRLSTSRRRNRRSSSPKRNGRSRSPRRNGRSRSPRRNGRSRSPRKIGQSRSPGRNGRSRYSRSSSKRRGSFRSPHSYDRRRSRSRSRKRSRSKSSDAVAASIPVNLSHVMAASTITISTTTTTDTKPSKSIADFTALCKKLTENEMKLDNDGAYETNENASQSSPAYHPFSVKPAKDIVITPVILPIPKKIEPTRPLEQAFPVSSGNQHKTKENTSKTHVEGVDGSIAATEQVFQTATIQEKLDVSGLIAKRMEAQNRLQSNPQDFEARLVLEEVQMKMQSWASVNLKPGQFTGETLVNSSKENINSGYQAWAKKDMFQNLNPIRGGVGMRLLQKMGWKPGQVIGKRGEGSYEPIALDVKTDRKGLVSSTEAGPPGKGAGKGGGKNVRAAQAVQGGLVIRILTLLASFSSFLALWIIAT
ncbi:serine/arginine repetitive matrix protein 2-like isoform X2 [Xenia sp. Carnegie-2017]|uniref:serine/arginine repetitive matrix protein 2-like isoform X2 n=1 Tax=Xenia sp. Carnegie-2017 TaxID=2897299 RepID=UPI001F0474C6|nr:serine/arginine repetitive matrix protein 2-like isoform X2 [Xenia sp. Carnegie-2017]